MLFFFFYFGNNSAEDIIKKTAEEVIHSIRSPAIAYTISTFWLSGQASSAILHPHRTASNCYLKDNVRTMRNY